MKKYQIIGIAMVLIGVGRLLFQTEPWIGEVVLKVLWHFINQGYAFLFGGCAILLAAWTKQINNKQIKIL